MQSSRKRPRHQYARSKPNRKTKVHLDFKQTKNQGMGTKQTTLHDFPELATKLKMPKFSEKAEDEHASETPSLEENPSASLSSLTSDLAPKVQEASTSKVQEVS